MESGGLQKSLWGSVKYWYPSITILLPPGTLLPPYRGLSSLLYHRFLTSGCYTFYSNMIMTSSYTHVSLTPYLPRALRFMLPSWLKLTSVSSGHGGACIRQLSRVHTVFLQYLLTYRATPSIFYFYFFLRTLKLTLKYYFAQPNILSLASYRAIKTYSLSLPCETSDFYTILGRSEDFTTPLSTVNLSRLSSVPYHRTLVHHHPVVDRGYSPAFLP
jgi:hypothetical protein